MKKSVKVPILIGVFAIIIAGILTFLSLTGPRYDYRLNQQVNDNSYYAEGPLWHDGSLYYVEYARHRVMKWNGETSDKIWKVEGCGPASLIETPDNNLLVSCYDNNTLVVIDFSGPMIRKIDRDDSGRPFTGPNDFARDRAGGIYFTASGRFDTKAPPEGKIFYLSQEGSLRESASGLHYPNGLAVSHNGTELYANEHLAKKVTIFMITEPGVLGEGKVFAETADLSESPNREDPYSGPDGLKMNRRGHLFVCHYGASEILILDSNGEKITAVDIPDRYVTNACFGKSEKELFITTAVDAWTPPYPGKVYRFRME